MQSPAMRALPFPGALPVAGNRLRRRPSSANARAAAGGAHAIVPDPSRRWLPNSPTHPDLHRRRHTARRRHHRADRRAGGVLRGAHLQARAHRTGRLRPAQARTQAPASAAAQAQRHRPAAHPGTARSARALHHPRHRARLGPRHAAGLPGRRRGGTLARNPPAPHPHRRTRRAASARTRQEAGPRGDPMPRGRRHLPPPRPRQGRPGARVRRRHGGLALGRIAHRRGLGTLPPQGRVALAPPPGERPRVRPGARGEQAVAGGVATGRHVPRAPVVEREGVRSALAARAAARVGRRGVPGRLHPPEAPRPRRERGHGGRDRGAPRGRRGGLLRRGSRRAGAAAAVREPHAARAPVERGAGRGRARARRHPVGGAAPRRASGRRWPSTSTSTATCGAPTG